MLDGKLGRWALALFAIIVGACDDPLKPTEIVQESRVIGARAEVEGEPQRAAAFPGERTLVRFLVAAPELEPKLGYALIACRATPNSGGVGSCRGPVFGERTRLMPEPAAPEIDFVLPEPNEAETQPRLLVSGVICEGGSPLASETPSACESGARAMRVSLELDLATDREQNQNPSFAAAQILLDGADFAAPAPLEPECQGSGLLEVSSGSAHGIRLDFPESTRDPLERDNPAAADRESILISHFASDGDLERAFSPVTPETPEISAEIAWTAPAVSDAGGRLVRFWFVVRDLRGGSDFAERALCVVP